MKSKSKILLLFLKFETRLFHIDKDRVYFLNKYGMISHPMKMLQNCNANKSEFSLTSFQTYILN